MHVCDSSIEDIEIQSVLSIILSIAENTFKTYIIFLLFALILDNKWIAEIYDLIDDKKQLTHDADKCVHLRQCCAYLVGVIYPTQRKHLCDRLCYLM